MSSNFETYLLFIALLSMCMLLKTVSSSAEPRKTKTLISCFVCDSRNYTREHCHDPFNAALTTFKEQCKVPKPNYIGEFPAHFCVKIMGISVVTKEAIVIRSCSLENMDNQCGKFRFEDELIEGCILTCDSDGCNKSIMLRSTNIIVKLIILLTIISIT